MNENLKYTLPAPVDPGLLPPEAQKVEKGSVLCIVLFSISFFLGSHVQSLRDPAKGHGRFLPQEPGDSDLLTPARLAQTFLRVSQNHSVPRRFIGTPSKGVHRYFPKDPPIFILFA